MTAAEQHALEQIYAATITPEEWANRIENGYHGKPYKFRDTRYFQALVELRKAGAGGGTSPGGGPTPTPTPAPNPYAALAQNVMFTAWDPEAGLRAPAHWTLAITADQNVSGSPRDHVTKAKRATYAARSKGMQVAVWANQEQIPWTEIDGMVAVVQPNYIIIQGETAAEWQSALAAGGCHVIVGNPNAATEPQRARAAERVNAGDLGVCFETYTNEGAPWPDQSSAAGVPVHSFCLGVGWGKNPNLQLADYKPHTSSWPTISVYLAEKMSDESWGLLP